MNPVQLSEHLMQIKCVFSIVMLIVCVSVRYLSPAQTPTQILFSDDQSLGVAFLRHANETCAWPTDDSPMVNSC